MEYSSLFMHIDPCGSVLLRAAFSLQNPQPPHAVSALALQVLQGAI